MLQFRDREDQRAMAMKEYTAFPQSSSITGASPSGHTLARGLTPLQRCSRCILQLQPSGLIIVEERINAIITFSRVIFILLYSGLGTHVRKADFFARSLGAMYSKSIRVTWICEIPIHEWIETVINENNNMWALLYSPLLIFLIGEANLNLNNKHMGWVV